MNKRLKFGRNHNPAMRDMLARQLADDADRLGQGIDRLKRAGEACARCSPEIVDAIASLEVRRQRKLAELEQVKGER